MAAKLLYHKLQDSHGVHERDQGFVLLYADPHFLIEVISAQTYQGLGLAGRGDSGMR